VRINTGEAERSMTSLANASTESMRNAATEVERVLGVVTNGIGGALKQNASDVERTLLSVSAEVARGFVGKADEIAAAVSARAGEMTRILDVNSSTLLQALSNKSREFTGEVQRATQTAVSAIESKGFDFTRTMLDNSNELARQINDAGETATSQVTETLRILQDQTRDALAQSQRTTEEALTVSQRTTQEVLAVSQRTAQESVAQIMETQTKLRSESTTLFEHMREANLLLHEVLTGAHENMSAIESNLTKRVTEFANVMNDVTARSGAAGEQIHAHVNSFNTETANVLENLSGLAQQFDQQGQSLAQVVAAIQTSNVRTDEVVNERRAALETLVAALDVKTEDLDRRLQRFTTLLDQSLEGAETRAREIGRMIAEASSGGTRSIAEQFELVRETTEQERQRTSEVMRSIYEQSIGETDAIFRQSADRFADVLMGMKEMASEMQSQLDHTRNELKRGILELPQETAEATAQMRRVVVDQIEALAELNRIVSRHGRNVEVAEPRRGQEPMLTVVGGGRSEPAARSQPRHVDHPPAQPVSAPPAPQPMPRRPDMPPPHAPAQPQGGPNQSGWLSDLLHRAGGDEAHRGGHGPQPPRGHQAPPAAPQRPSLDSLDALSVDIARLVDHNAAVDMWDRYNAGERNAFTRQLYTPHGQRVFDDIRNRYRADRNFHATVDRYLAEFERLLEDVSRDERGGQAMVRTYLTSETGKVYTLLAHASGRFD
jgi:ABC-type transporter Mla subunit MlaD